MFVHVLDPTGEQLWTDDHLPAPPTSAWKPGQTVEYTRTVFVPNYPYIGEATVRLGLYTTARPEPPDAERAARSPEGIPGRQVPASAAVREHLPYLQGWLAPGRGRRPTTPRPNGSGRRRPRRSRSRIPKKDSTFYLEYRRAHRSVQAAAAGHHPDRGPDHRHLRGRQSRPEAADLPDYRGAVRVRRHDGAGDRRRSDLQCPAAATCASSASGSSTPSSNRSRSTRLASERGYARLTLGPSLAVSATTSADTPRSGRI